MNDLRMLVPWFSLSVTITLLHLFWLGALIGVATFIANRCLARCSANARYLLNFTSLVVLFLCVPVTLTVVASTVPRAKIIRIANRQPMSDKSIAGYPELPDRSFVPSSEIPVEPPPSSVVARNLPSELPVASADRISGLLRQSSSSWIAGSYLIGVLAMLVRLFLGLSGGHRICRLARPIGEGKFRQLVERQASALGLRISPAVAYCEQVTVPAVVGIVRPVILLPISMIAGITPEQLSNVLTHELAHIRRFDHVAIVLQRLLEAVWFFHPAAWYVSRRLNRERENCCDDLVVAAGVERVSYAESLCRVAELTGAHRSNVLRPVMVAVDGRDRSHLHERIIRLLDGSSDPAVRLTRTGMFGVTATLALLSLPALLLPAVHGQAETQLAADKVQREAAPSLPPTEGATQNAGLPDYTKISGYVGNSSLPIGQPTVIWKFTSETKTRGNGQSYMIALTDSVVGDGVVYFASLGAPGQVFALSALDGAELWRHEHSSSRIRTRPSIDQDHVYFGSKTGVTALRRDSGKLVWNHIIDHGAGGGDPIPAGDRVYISGYDGITYALNRADGRVIWKHDFAADAQPDPPGFSGERARFQEIVARPRGSACDGEIFVQSVFDQSRLIALDCATGQRRWSFQAAGWIGPEPTIVNDRVYICSQDKHLYCLDRDTGRLVWKFEAPTWLSSRVAVHKGRVFLPVHHGRLYQLDAQSGEIIHKFVPAEEIDRKHLVYSFPIITDRCAYFATGEGQLYAIDVETSRPRWKFRPSERSELFTDPATDGLRIFVTSRQDIDDAGECSIIAIGLEAR